jgi:hypothetical protein
MFSLIAQVLCLFGFHGVHSNLSLLLLSSKPIVSSSHPCYSLFEPIMAPVIRVELNGSQALFLHNDVSEDLKIQGWDLLIKKLQGYNLQVAKEFALTFDGYREKVGEIQLEVTEIFLSEATGLPLIGQKWFKNSKLDEVPWSLFVTSRKIDCCDKGIPVSLLKVRWHGLLAVLKQFITYEGHYGLVFLYHV